MVSTAQPLNVKCQGDHITEGDLQRINVFELEERSKRHASHSAPGEHKVVMGTPSVVEVPLKVSATQAAVNELLHVSDKGKVPKKVLQIEVKCIEMTSMLLEIQELVKVHSLYN